jgi:hypothetical protein
MVENGRQIETDSLTQKQQKTIQTLLENPTVRAAAKAAGVGETTIFRWLAEPAFNRCYREARNHLLENTLTALQAASSEAVQTLRQVMQDAEAMVTARVSAARAILEFSLKAKEQLETEERLSELERRVEAQSKGNLK